MLNEPSDREDNEREVYRDMLVLGCIVVAMIALPFLIAALT